MFSNTSADEVVAARGIDLNSAATAVEHQEPSSASSSVPIVDASGGSVPETLTGADGSKTSSGGDRDGVLGGGDQGFYQSAQAKDSFVDAKPDFEGEGNGRAGKGVQEADSRRAGEALMAEMDVVKKDLDLAVPFVEAECLDGSSVEENAGRNGGIGDCVAADVVVAKGVNAAEAKSPEVPLVDGKVNDKDVVTADVRFDVVIGDENAEGDSKLGVEIGASKAVEVATASASLSNVLEDASPDNNGGCQKTEVVQRLEVDEKVPKVEDNMEGFIMDMGTCGVQNVQAREREMSKSREKQRQRASDAENNQHVMCYYAFQDEKKDDFWVSDMVWGKVRGHPWWPGQIFDPSDASEMALKHEKMDHYLVTYFGDKTFAWCDESHLKPFQTYFMQMEKQSSLDAFVTAVNDALGEVSKRIELGMTCHCLTDEACADMKHQKVENAGIREGTCSPAIDSSLIASSFQPAKFLDYIRALAQFPNGGADRFEFLIAKAQLKSFYRSKGYTELPLFVIGGGLENVVEASPARKRKLDNDVADFSAPVSSYSISGKGKSRGRGRPPKQKNILEDGRKQKSLSELMEEKNVPHYGDSGRCGSGARASSRSSGRKHKVVDSDSTGPGKSKKKRLDSLGDLETKSRSPARKKYSKVGDCMRRVADLMTGSPPILLKCKGETFQKSLAKVNGRGGDAVNDPHTHVETRKVKRGASKDIPSHSEMLSQLCLAARDPIQEYSFLSMIVSFFTDFRDSLASISFKNKKFVEVLGAKRGRRKSTSSMSASSEMSQPDFVQDSYWPDIVFREMPEKELVSSDRKRKRESQMKRQKKKKPAEEISFSVPCPVLDTPQHLQVGSASIDNGQEVAAERPMNNSEEIIEECMPTALVLNFNESNALPSESDLISIFGRYGPLREAEIEVLKKANCAKVVFKRRADAEVAFNSAGKSSIFGPAHVSYRLRYLPSMPKTSPNSTP
ncbi:uncharacterized protein LOC103706650 [Phoenix dactylifera]|uniref:Uncharacterized protein LOC103706650 n=1 Tax=Phoenix dactylifera TaxID=42345 RepID=A0A8B9ARA0_PHODC|nr:uncharacterized protein LOC103706650 [Phoenix dactylifera]XP_008789046.2 uncharacterized protein LOC103706650 [Phoenix dactylifera]XP_038988970.1 uncharacterized protein LOC103706650 [Phoenix dactylifera]